jgi:hypothetical protein
LLKSLKIKIQDSKSSRFKSNKKKKKNVRNWKKKRKKSVPKKQRN